MRRVAIVDYGMGNLDSVARAIEECGGAPVVTREKREFERAQAIVLPGVGSFARGMANLRQDGLDATLTEQVVRVGIPFLGICLGMQLLAMTGTEGGEQSGLGWLAGKVERLQCHDGERVPHVGWNEVSICRTNPLIDNDVSGRDFYFVHSYALACSTPGEVIGTTPYSGGFCSAVWKNNIFGVQFHPEKSRRNGFRVLRNFLAL